MLEFGREYKVLSFSRLKMDGFNRAEAFFKSLPLLERHQFGQLKAAQIGLRFGPQTKATLSPCGSSREAPAAAGRPGSRSGHVCPTLPTRAGNRPGTGRGEASPGAPSNPRRGEVRGGFSPPTAPDSPPGPPLPPCGPRHTLLPAATGTGGPAAGRGTGLGARRGRQ